VQQASAIVFCSDLMKEQFLEAFAEDAPDRLEVIYNGFDPQPQARFNKAVDSDRVNMVYAGNFYGKRDLSVIARVLADMKRCGDISAAVFRLHLYSRLATQDRAMIKELGLDDIIQVHGVVSYQEVQRLMCGADILFLLSGDDVNYAVPFKFFDYIRANRPIFAVAPKESMIARLMTEVDCGECVDLADSSDIRQTLSNLISTPQSYSFEGADRFHWANSARQYFDLIQDVVET
jgi:glycosyltransferase involved in cell wall biosynthesis